MKRFLLLVIFCLGMSCLYSNNIQDTLLTYASQSEGEKKIHQLLELSELNRNKNPGKSIEYANKALLISKEIENSELQYLSEFSAGFAYYVSNDFRNALEHLNKSLEISRQLNIREGEAASLNRLGNTYQLMGEYEKALGNYEQAMLINKELKDNQEIARSLTNLGSIYRLYGNYELAINQHLEALGMYEELQNNEGIAWSSLNIARLFKMMKNYKKGIEYVNQSLDIYKLIEADEGVSTGKTLCLKELGNIYYEMGELNKAIEYSGQVLNINSETGNQLGVANSLSTLGKIYYDLKSYGKAIDFLTRANELKDVLQDNTEKASILRYMGKIYLIEGKLYKANKYLNHSLNFAQNQNLKEDIKETYLALSELNEKTNNREQAYKYFKLYTNLKDSLNNQKINELELQYEFDKMQRQIEFEQKQTEAEQTAKLQKQKIYTWVFVGGFLFMIILAQVIFMSYKRKKKTNIVLIKQKNEIEEQKNEIEAQRDFVTRQRDQIARQNEIITDSIEYAKRIQTALFPQEKFLSKVLPEHFIYMKPKNIVSGDFYWVSEKGNKLVIVVSDCTGHGVPGAFMSMLGIAFLNEIVNKSKVLKANKILDQLRGNIIESLHQEYGTRGSKDGMDMALCILDKQSLKMQYAGAYNSIFIVRNEEIKELKADKMPIGIHAIKVEKSFTNNEFDLKKEDMLYLFSDGYIDQFGGEEGLKFKQKAFKELLATICNKSMKEQKENISKTMKKWQGEHSQLDDMMIMGIRI